MPQPLLLLLLFLLPRLRRRCFPCFPRPRHGYQQAVLEQFSLSTTAFKPLFRVRSLEQPAE